MNLIVKASFLYLFVLASVLDPWMQPAPSTVSAFIDVTLVPMDRNRAIEKQSLVVRDGRIVEIGNARAVRIPDNAQVISGKGMFLIPGLTDMHVHLHSKSDALLFVVNGVTTVRNMRGTPLHLAWRPEIENGKLLAPSIFSCGPILDGHPPTGENVTILQSNEEIEKNIAHQKQLGFDCVKVYNRLSPEFYSAIVESAHRHQMSVAGHVPFRVGLSGALAMQQDTIEHLTGYMSALRSEQGRIDENKIPELARKTKKAGVWNCPTLVVQKNLTEAGEDFEKLSSRPEMRFVPPSRLEMWNPARNARFQALDEKDFEGARRGLEILDEWILQLNRAGARLLLGTDAPSHFVVPGFSAHQELENLVHAGLTPFQALETGTKNPAEFLKSSQKFGTIEQGKRADLILVRCNPLRNISCTKQIEGVMLRGSWIPNVKIQQILNSVVTSYNIPKNRFEEMPEPGPVTVRYEMISSGTVIGEERLTIVREGFDQIISQQVTDPPLESTAALKISESNDEVRFEIDSLRVEGRSQAEIRLAGQIANMQATLPYKQNPEQVRIQVPDNTILDAPFIGAKAWIAPRLLEIEIGKTVDFAVKEFDFGYFVNRDFDLQDGSWIVQRMSETDFAISISSQYQQTTAKMILSGEGIPELFQKGTRSFRRID